MKYSLLNGTRISRITLGTAQLGLEYGIANKSGRPDLQTARKILDLAVNSGINTFDTASAYGDSEQIIGDFLKQHVTEDFTIITKIPKLDMTNNSFDDIYENVKKSVVSSIKRLNLKQIPICLLHSGTDMIACNGLVAKSLSRLKQDGLVRMIGVSVYTPDEVKEFLQREEFDVIQVPINLFNMRLIENGFLEKLRRKNTIIFARSVFLQGLFFLDPLHLPENLQLAKEPLLKLRKLSSELGISIRQLAFVFVRDLPEVSSVIIGVETPDQLLDNIKIENCPPISQKVRQTISDIFKDLPEKLINPAIWKDNVK